MPYLSRLSKWYESAEGWVLFCGSHDRGHKGREQGAQVLTTPRKGTDRGRVWGDMDWGIVRGGLCWRGVALATLWRRLGGDGRCESFRGLGSVRCRAHHQQHPTRKQLQTPLGDLDGSWRRRENQGSGHPSSTHHQRLPPFTSIIRFLLVSKPAHIQIYIITPLYTSGYIQESHNNRISKPFSLLPIIL